MSQPTEIEITEYIGDSLQKINTNFSLLDSNLKTLISGVNSLSSISTYTIQTNNLITELENKIQGEFFPSLCQVRLSVKDSNTICMQPYNGGNIGLYNTHDNVWNAYSLTSAIELNISQHIIGESAVLDIYTYCSNSTPMLTCFKWPPNTGELNVNLMRGTFNGVVVKKDYPDMRFLGCVQSRDNILQVNKSSQNVWNKYNQETNTIYNGGSVSVILGEPASIVCDIQIQSPVPDEASLNITGVKLVTYTVQNSAGNYTTSYVLSSVTEKMYTLKNSRFSTARDTVNLQLNAGYYYISLSAINEQYTTTDIAVTLQN